MNPDKQSNRAWLLTAPGSAAIAVVRIAGPGVEDFLRGHFSRPVLPGAMTHGNLTDAGKVLDDPVVMRLENGAADVCLHGGTWIVQAMLDLLQREGFGLLNFKFEISDDKSQDAFWDGGESDIEREMLAYLPLAMTELAVKMLLREPAAWERFALTNQDIRRQQAQEILADHSLWWLLHPPRVAIVGVANAGKSTLANQLFATQRSITADLPGTTRDWIGETANIDGLAITLIDTPGLRETSDPIEQAALAASAATIAAADWVVLVLDVSQPLDDAQLALLRRWPAALVVANKSDLAVLAAGDWKSQISNFKLPEGDNVIACDALHGVGIDLLRRQIRARFVADADDLDKPRWWTQRQRDWLNNQAG